jgi:glycosyltransferase involved in cell wall biosynthesis
VLVVGAGTHFLSAMSYYTIRLVNALAQRFPVAFIPMRKLIPSVLYPGRARIGAISTCLTLDPTVESMEGIDWYWGRNLIRDLLRFREWRPDIVIFQWWSGSVLHTYLAIALLARLRRAVVIVECHEILDSGEQRLAFARAWSRVLGRPFFRLAEAFVIHSEADRRPIEESLRVGRRPCIVIPHGPNDHHAADVFADNSTLGRLRSAPEDALNILFFGLIRPYKGLEDLIQAFEMLGEDDVSHYWLTVVGETWEGWDLPLRLIARSRYRRRITVVNRFVDDDEVIGHFAGADAVVLPYRRSSASSPASVAMANGLPLVLTEVGGLPEAVAEYEGAILVPPQDPPALSRAIKRLPTLRGRRYRDPHTWESTVDAYAGLMKELRMRRVGSSGKMP